MPAFQMRSTFHIYRCTSHTVQSQNPHIMSHSSLSLCSQRVKHNFTHTQPGTWGLNYLNTCHLKPPLLHLTGFWGIQTVFLFIIIICIIYSCLCLFIYKWLAECTPDCFLFYSRPKSRVNAMLVEDLYFTLIIPALSALWDLCGTSPVSVQPCICTVVEITSVASIGELT